MQEIQNILIINEKQSCAKIKGKLQNVILNFGGTEYRYVPRRSEINSTEVDERDQA